MFLMTFLFRAIVKYSGNSKEARLSETFMRLRLHRLYNYIPLEASEWKLKKNCNVTRSISGSIEPCDKQLAAVDS
jgi:hypothetical protein